MGLRLRSERKPHITARHGNDRLTSFDYDSANRIIRKTYESSEPSYTVGYLYDDMAGIAVPNGVGKPARARVAEGGAYTSIVKFLEYDKVGRPTRAEYTVAGTSKQISTAYDGLGRIESITYPDSEQVRYLYDTAGNLKEVVGYAKFPSYTALGQVKAISFQNGVTTTQGYWDTHQRLLSIQTAGPAPDFQPLLDLTYDVYDSFGNIQSIKDNINTGRSQTFTYTDNSKNRLKLAQSPSSYGNLQVNCDKVDNITSYTPVGAYTLKTGSAHLTATAGPYTFGYDGNGNTINRVERDGNQIIIGRRTITYDYDNRPKSVTYKDGATTFGYDFMGQRVRKESASGSTLYFGNLYECSGGSCAKHIFAGAQRIATKKSATEIHYYHPDHLGSLRVVTNGSGQWVQKDFYAPFGKTWWHTGSQDLDYKFTGQEQDSETDLYYYKARYYDPVIGRFVTADPIMMAYFDPATFPRLKGHEYLPSNPPVYALVGNGGSPSGGNGSETSIDPMKLWQAQNIYAYCGNNPIAYVDPTGETWWYVLGFVAGFGIDGSNYGACLRWIAVFYCWSYPRLL